MEFGYTVRFHAYRGRGRRPRPGRVRRYTAAADPLNARLLDLLRDAASRGLLPDWQP